LTGSESSSGFGRRILSSATVVSGSGARRAHREGVPAVRITEVVQDVDPAELASRQVDEAGFFPDRRGQFRSCGLLMAACG
jgi:hypothetical protein